MAMQERRFTITLAQGVWTWVGLAVTNLFYAAGVTGDYGIAFAGSLFQLIALAALLAASTVVARVEEADRPGGRNAR